MNFKLACVPLVVMLLAGCEGATCPAIAVPVYEVNVYDAVSGELICYEGMGSMPASHTCEISYDYSEDGESADITVSLTGFASETLVSVANETWRSGCWDNPDYTTTVDFYLSED